MHGLPFKDVDYCKYGMPYRKRTRLWNNIEQWNPRPLCARDCDSMDEDRKKHLEVAQRMPSGKKSTWGDRQAHSQQDKINKLRLKQKIKITFNRIEWRPKILKNKPKQQKQ